MIYLFFMSVAPTVPAAWLTFSSTVVYKIYDTKQRMWGISAISDQQMAGLLMKLGETAYLWTLITIRFFKWAARNEEADRRGRSVTERELLTWDQVALELDALGPAPKETEVD
jgi:putative membrane protein